MMGEKGSAGLRGSPGFAGDPGNAGAVVMQMVGVYKGVDLAGMYYNKTLNT